MKIAITGTSGFVGKKLLEYFEDAIPVTSLQGKTDAEIERIIGELEADVLIHTAAMSDIGACQADPEGSRRANVVLPTVIARSFQGQKLICFSSDQVYSGSEEPGPYTEDMAMPGNLYSQEKLEMEHRVLEINPDAVMLRAEWMYDAVSYKGNYYLNVLAATESVSFSSRQYRGITYLQEVAEVMPQVMKLPGGAYNFGSETNQNMYDITRQFVNLIGKQIEVMDCEGGHNLWMDCSKARRYGVIFDDVSEGLKRCWKSQGICDIFE